MDPCVMETVGTENVTNRQKYKITGLNTTNILQKQYYKSFLHVKKSSTYYKECVGIFLRLL